MRLRYTVIKWYSYDLDAVLKGPWLLSFGQLHREGLSVWAFRAAVVRASLGFTLAQGCPLDALTLHATALR